MCNVEFILIQPMSKTCQKLVSANVNTRLEMSPNINDNLSTLNACLGGQVSSIQP